MDGYDYVIFCLFYCCCCCCCCCSYPDAEWIHRGTFEASNERKIHSFSFIAHENIYAKFIKVCTTVFFLLDDSIREREGEGEGERERERFLFNIMFQLPPTLTFMCETR